MARIDLTDREVRHLVCGTCGRPYDRVVVFATRDDRAYALVSAVCHGHDDSEAWLDVTFGSWQEPDFPGHVTFSCRVHSAGAQLVDPLVASKGDADYYGRRLVRGDALGHPQVNDLWEVVDEVVKRIPEVDAAVNSERQARP